MTENQSSSPRPAVATRTTKTAAEAKINPFIERFIGTLRRELLDHVIVLNQSHLDRLLREYIDEYYHVARPHQGLDHDTPVPHDKPTPAAGSTKLISTPVVGGLHHTYERVAA